MGKILSSFGVTGAILSILLLAIVAHAQTPITLQNPLSGVSGGNCNTLSCPAQAIINFFYTIAIPICGIMILVGGFQMMTAAGSPEKFSNGKKTILYAVIGFIVVLLAGSVAALIQNVL